MRFEEVLFLYLCIGLAVSLRVPWSQRPLVLPLWPLYLPSLLTPPTARFDTVAPPMPAVKPPPPDEVSRALQRLSAALALWSPAPTLPLAATERALTNLAHRKDALAALLALPENQPGDAVSGSDALARRRENLRAMALLHSRLRMELSEALLRLDELATRIQLAHFSGTPMDDIGVQLAHLMQAVEHVQAAHTEIET